MKKKFWLVLVALLFTGTALSFSSYDASIKSHEVKSDDGSYVYVRFRLNIPVLEDYLEERIDEETDDEKLEKYENTLDLLESGYDIENVWVFGDFNSWATAVSDVPNELVQSSKNSDTWYAKTYVAIYHGGEAGTHRYKFVIDLGLDEYLYVEDPLNDNYGDDGFDGYNSEFYYAP